MHRGPAAPRPRPVDRRRRGRHRQQGRERRPARATPSATVRHASRRRRRTPQAVRLGLEQRRPPTDAEWVWLLHDDANPAPDALGRLLAAAAADPAGRHPRPQAARVALAASGCSRSASRSPAPAGARPGWSAASTTRASTTRSATCSRSTPPACWCAARCSTSSAASTTQLPMFGNDLDFGWRAARPATGPWWCPRPWSSTPRPRTAGVRRTPLTGRHTHYQERRAALYTLLANVPGARAAVAGWSGSFFGTLLRMLGFLLRPLGRRGARRAGRAGLASTPAPARSARARQARRAGSGRPDDVRRAAGALVGALPARPRLRRRPRDRARPTRPSDVADRRRAAKEAATRPAPLRPAASRRRRGRAAEDTGLVARFFTNPRGGRARAASWCCRSSARREAFGTVTGGGALRRRPADARRLVAACTSSRGTRSGTGTAVPAPPYVAADGAARLAARRQRRRGGRPRCCCSPYRSRCGAPGGCCAWSAGWSTPAGSPRWLVALGAVTYALVPGDLRRLGRRPARRRSRSAVLLPVAGARRARLRRPRARPPLARRLALRPAARAAARRSRRWRGCSRCC